MEKGFRKECIAKFEGGYLYGREVLNILLANAFSGQDMTGLVEELLYVFPSASAVLDADFAALMTVRGMTRPIAEYIVVLGKTRKALQQPLKYVGSSGELIEYGIEKYRGRDCESAELYCVNKNGKVLFHRCYESEFMAKVVLDFRNVIVDITNSGAWGFYLLHNHVYGKIRPSAKDDAFTAKLAAVSNAGSVRFLDHCIVGEREGFSYRQSGRLSGIEQQLKKGNIIE